MHVLVDLVQSVHFFFDLGEDVEQIAEVVLVDEQLTVGVELPVTDIDLEKVQDRRQAILMSRRLL